MKSNANIVNDRFGGIFASQAIRLIGKIYSQTINALYLWRMSANVSLPSLGIN